MQRAARTSARTMRLEGSFTKEHPAPRTLASGCLFGFLLGQRDSSAITPVRDRREWGRSIAQRTLDIDPEGVGPKVPRAPRSWPYRQVRGTRWVACEPPKSTPAIRCPIVDRVIPVPETAQVRPPEDLRLRASELLPIVRRQARRPFIVELAGTPKAGKSTALEVLRSFFEHCGYQVEVMRERAKDCPIVMKGHFFFNTWTTTTMLASMIEKLDTDADILLLDRGVFDSIVWLEKQQRAFQVSAKENQIFREFALLDRWRSLTDLTCVLTVSPTKAMERSKASQLVPHSGSIVTEDFLVEYNKVLSDVQRDVADRFRFVNIDTTEYESTRQTNLQLAGILLDNMRRWVDPEIAAIPRTLAEELFANENVRSLDETIEALERNVVFRTRSDLETDADYVQLVAAAILRHDERMVLLRRDAPQDPKRLTFGRDTLWKGCHIARSASEGSALLATAESALIARLKEDFHIATLDSAPIPHSLVWTTNDKNEKEAKHMGIFFDLKIQSGESLAGKVFKRERNGTRDRLQELVRPAELYSRMSSTDLQLEPWSQCILRQLVHNEEA